MDAYENTVQASPQEITRDDALRQQLLHELSEAAERATFHRVEAERWERVGRAAGAGIVQLDSCTPVAGVSADELVERSRPTKQAGQVMHP